MRQVGGGSGRIIGLGTVALQLTYRTEKIICLIYALRKKAYKCRDWANFSTSWSETIEKNRRIETFAIYDGRTMNFGSSIGITTGGETSTLNEDSGSMESTRF